MFKIVAMFGSLLLFTSSQVFATCSPYVGDATLNEIMTEGGNGDAFIEFELLNTSISSTTYDQWTLRICHDEGSGNNKSSQCKNISVADMNDVTQWIWAEEPIIDKDFIDFKEGFDLALLDENNKFIDYIQIGGYSAQNFTSSCSYDDLEYVFSIPLDVTNGTKILLRKPDGTGRWLEAKNLNQYPPTPGANNDGLDHFEIIHDGQGLTCEAESITIKACANSSCTILNHDANNVQLSINGSFDQTVTVVGGSTETSFSYTSVGVAVLSLDKTYQCVNGASSSCDVIFADSGFIFGNASNSLPIIATQLSGKPSDTGFNSEDFFFLQAVQTDDNTGSCVGLFPGGEDVPVNLSYTCHGDSSVCTSNLVLTNNATEILLTKSAVEQNLRFNSDSKAYFSLKYPDAGKLIVNAQKDIDIGGLGEIKNFSASSNAFVVRPFGFQLDFSQDVDSADALASNTSGSDFKKAGETFSLRAVAKQWAANQDNDNDGIPDDFTDLNSNDIAKNFDNEQLDVTRELFLPDPATASAGVLTAETSNSFFASILDNEYSFSEVGIIHLSASLLGGDYIGGGDIQGYIANVGRFTPAYFIQTVEENGDLNAKHSLSTDCEAQNWAYSGQETDSVGTITYGFPPELLITAYNTDGFITENYTYSGFMKLSASGIKVTLPTEDFEKDRIDPDVLEEKIKITSVMTSGEEPIVKSSDPSVERSGVLNYEFNSADHFIYEHNAHSKYAPFPAKIPFVITQVQDSDLIKLYSGLDPDITPTEQVVTEGVEIRFGRWYIANAFGPETSLLPMPMYAQYWNGTEFKVNTDDNCTVPNIEGEINTGEIRGGGLTDWQYRLLDASTDIDEPIRPSHTQVTAPDPLTAFSDGVYREFIFSIPGNGNRGSLNLEYEVPAWLKYDWQNNGSFEYNPTATATFGLFRGNDRIIYQREVY